MTRRMKKLMITIASLAALALGGSALAQASTNAAPEPKAAETDTVQSGDQTTPDTPATTARAHKPAAHHKKALGKKATDPAGVGSGDQTTPDAAGSPAETPGTETPETAGSESGPSDGAGGHADTPGANVDYQSQAND
jgi:hypothetical protein